MKDLYQTTLQDGSLHSQKALQKQALMGQNLKMK